MIDVPTPGNLIKTVSELVVSSNSSVSNQIVINGSNILYADLINYLPFDTIDPDNDGSTGGTSLEWSISTPTLVKVLKDGNYAVSGAGYFSADTAAADEYLQLYVGRLASDGTTELGPNFWIIQREPRITGKQNAITWSMVVPMLAGQYFALEPRSSQGSVANGVVNGSLVVLGPI